MLVSAPHRVIYDLFRPRLILDFFSPQYRLEPDKIRSSERWIYPQRWRLYRPGLFTAAESQQKTTIFVSAKRKHLCRCRSLGNEAQPLDERNYNLFMWLYQYYFGRFLNIFYPSQKPQQSPPASRRRTFHTKPRPPANHPKTPRRSSRQISP